MEIKRIYYGEANDDFVEIKTLADKMKLNLCMKLFKTHETLESLENAIKNKSLTKVSNL